MDRLVITVTIIPNPEGKGHQFQFQAVWVSAQGDITLCEDGALIATALAEGARIMAGNLVSFRRPGKIVAPAMQLVPKDGPGRSH